MGTQLHELLAVEGDLKGVQEKMLAESKKVFERNELFMGVSKRLNMVDDNRKHEEAAGSQERAMTTTVTTRLLYTSESVIRYYDALLQKELTNQKATADLSVDGVDIAEGLPATFLLGLENKLKALREVYGRTPTLQAGIHWEPDATMGEDIFVTKNPEVANKTEKIIVPQILYEATKEHPAQVKELSRDTVVGAFTTIHWSGMITSARKRELLERVDHLIQAVKKARMKANETEVVTGSSIGEKIFEYIHNGK
jgi:hypothetical protein